MKHMILAEVLAGLVMGLVGFSFAQEKALPPKVMTGLDVLQQEDFQRLKGLRVGLVINHSALNQKGEHILDIMLKSGNVKVAAILAPEHGIRGTGNGKIANGRDEKTGLTVYSLYGETRRPTPEMLKNMDAFVFDIQDIGARFYTYISTMAMCMEEAKNNNKKFMVLDRPNPIGGLKVDGPIQDKELLHQFISYFPMPVMHGMTIGEMARMFNEEHGIHCDLQVVEMKGWERGMYFDDTGLPWVNPSPNIRKVADEIVYPGVGMTEKAISVGRGTKMPFEIFGAPWIKADELIAELDARHLPGIKFAPVSFTPEYQMFKGKLCNGLRLTLTDRKAFKPVITGMHIIDALYKLYPNEYKIEIGRAHV